MTQQINSNDVTIDQLNNSSSAPEDSSYLNKPFFGEQKDEQEIDLALEMLKNMNPAELMVAIKSELQAVISMNTDYREKLEQIAHYLRSKVIPAIAKIDDIDNRLKSLENK